MMEMPQISIAPSIIRWTEDGESCSALWRSEAGVSPPARVQVSDDALTADAAFRLASGGTAMLWRSDFQNARQLLQAMARRIDRKPHRPQQRLMALPPRDIFHLQRMAQVQRARMLGMLLIPVGTDHQILLRRAPDVRQACEEAHGPAEEPYVISLRELLGLIGAHEWRKKGIGIPALGARIHPYYGVFSPVRGEYVSLVAETPFSEQLSASLANQSLAFDIGTGTGVLTAILIKRGVARVVATDREQRALVCARENFDRLGVSRQVEVLQADLYPPGRAPLVVCNPPWVPARANSALDQAVYDPDSRMLRGFLGGLAEHLDPGGEGWLILSDLAEHLGLRSRADLLALIDKAGLNVLGRLDVRPTHPRVKDSSDPLHLARAAEVTSLWRLGAKP